MGRKTLAKKVAPPREGKSSYRSKDVKLEPVTEGNLRKVLSMTQEELKLYVDPLQLYLFD